MGWFDPANGFVANEASADQVNLFSPIGMPSTGKRNGILSDKQLTRLRRDYGMACEVSETKPLSVFDTGGETAPQRALYTTKKFPGEIRSGMMTIRLDETLMAKINRILGWPGQGVLRRDEAIGVRSQSFFYSLHKLYNAKTGQLREEAVVLHRKSGEIVAHEVNRDLDSGQLCDGCGIPRYENADGLLYRPLNIFELSGFAYPVLLLDTSTFEGRALSLFTFTPDNEPDQYRVYEYVIHCP
jgi:hypothetical protein